MANNIKLYFRPAKNPNKTGILLVPGGGYANVAVDHEGEPPAAWLNERGYDVWILEYTVADAEHPPPIYPAPQNEAIESIRRIRAEGRVEKLGMFGFSAGGHLTAVTLTNSEVELDFGILAYPVISMDPAVTHMGSRTNLIGEAPSAELELLMSADKQVGQRTPPILLFHTANDDAVPLQNTLRFANAMTAHQRPLQMLVLPDGPHGISLALDNPKLNWTDELERWLKLFVADL